MTRKIGSGTARGDAAKVGGVGLQTVRDWVLAFNAEGPAGLINGKAPGKPPLLETQSARPWRLPFLAQALSR